MAKYASSTEASEARLGKKYYNIKKTRRGNSTNKKKKKKGSRSKEEVEREKGKIHKHFNDEQDEEEEVEEVQKDVAEKEQKNESDEDAMEIDDREDDNNDRKATEVQQVPVEDPKDMVQVSELTSAALSAAKGRGPPSAEFSKWDLSSRLKHERTGWEDVESLVFDVLVSCSRQCEQHISTLQALFLRYLHHEYFIDTYGRETHEYDVHNHDSALTLLMASVPKSIDLPAMTAQKSGGLMLRTRRGATSLLLRHLRLLSKLRNLGNSTAHEHMYV